MNYNKPTLLISQCLEFDSCRYDGKMIANDNIKKLKEYINFITVCPEIEIGLGVPRKPVNLIKNKLYQVNTNKDISPDMEKFSENFIKNINHLDGIILKSKSPSCGIKTTRKFTDKNLNKISKLGSGLFAYHLIKKFPDIPKQEDSDLNSLETRDHFYKSIFIIAEFRKIKTIKELYVFHTKHKLLLMSINQLDLKKLGKIAANSTKKLIKKNLHKYYTYLLKILSKTSTNGTHINTQMHAFGYYKKNLSKKEKQDFLIQLKKFKNNEVPLSEIIDKINSWNIKFENTYLLKQSYFNPYPKELIH